MKKSYKLEDLDCANCAAKMERMIGEIDGVQSVTVSFLAQKLMLEAEENDLDRILKEAAKICRKVDPDCELIIG